MNTATPRLQRTRKKCWAIRNRVYSEAERPARLFDNLVLEHASNEKVLLEIGCGREATWLRKMAGHFRAGIGVDLQVTSTASRGSQCALLVGDAHAIPLAPKTVDVIVCRDALEHFANPVLTFMEWARVLRPNGWVLVSTVNKFFYPVLLARIFPFALRRRINAIVSGTAEENTFPVFYRANTRRAIRRLAVRAGLLPVSINYVSCHPTYLVFNTLVYRIGVAIERITNRHECFAPLRHLIHGALQLPNGPAS